MALLVTLGVQVGLVYSLGQAQPLGRTSVMADDAVLEGPTLIGAGDLTTFVTLVVPLSSGLTAANAALTRLRERLFHGLAVHTRGIHEAYTDTDRGLVQELMSTHVVSLLAQPRDHRAAQSEPGQAFLPLAAIPTVISTFVQRLQLRALGMIIDGAPVLVHRSHRPWQDFAAGTGPRVLVRSKPLPVRPRLRFPLQMTASPRETLHVG